MAQGVVSIVWRCSRAADQAAVVELLTICGIDEIVYLKLSFFKKVDKQLPEPGGQRLGQEVHCRSTPR